MLYCRHTNVFKLVYTVVPKFVIVTLSFEKFFMCSMLHNLSIVNDVDLINILDGGQSVGNGDGCSANLSCIQSILDNLNKMLGVLEGILGIYLIPFHSQCQEQRWPHQAAIFWDS